MNKVILKGNLACDPEVRTITTGAGKETKVANFRLAVSRFYKKANGEKDKDTTFISCEAWDTGAELIEKLLHKGDPVLLDGSLKVEVWEVEGGKRSQMKVRVANFEKLYRSNRPQNGDDAIPQETVTAEEPTESAEPAEAAAIANGEDIPF